MYIAHKNVSMINIDDLYKNNRNTTEWFLLDQMTDMEYLEVLTEGLERVLMVRGGGREVITIYS